MKHAVGDFYYLVKVSHSVQAAAGSGESPLDEQSMSCLADQNINCVDVFGPPIGLKEETEECWAVR